MDQQAGGGGGAGCVVRCGDKGGKKRGKQSKQK